ICDSTMFEIIETQKGKKCLIFNDYRYLCDRIRNITTYWRCENRGECPGRLTEKAGEMPLLTAQHNHEPNEEKNKQEIFITHLKRQIRENQTPIRKIFRGEIINQYTAEPDNVCISELPAWPGACQAPGGLPGQATCPG
ncbi:unnamed protein product, partial [Rotaria sp. Silwood2]